MTQALLAASAYQYGKTAREENLQRILPNGWLQDYSSFWFAGYDNKPIPVITNKAGSTQ